MLQPQWLCELLAAGFTPYIATSARLLPALNTKPFGVDARCFVMEDENHHAFHEAYLLANSLSFKSPDLKMPHWVLIDCALMQTAVVGFVAAKTDISENLLHYFQHDISIDCDALDCIPVTGQIASPAVDGKSLVGLSLFSLAKEIDGPKMMGLCTKALAMEVHGGQKYEHYYGIAQYDNPSLRIHGRFSPRMEIYEPIVRLHPKKEMTFVYKMKIDYDAQTITAPPPSHPTPSFWLDAQDTEQKKTIQKGLPAGKRYIIAPPFSVEKDGRILLPIIEES